MTSQTDPLALLLSRRSSLENGVTKELTARALFLVAMYRHGPYKLEICFSDGEGSYWTRSTAVTKSRAWKQDELDDCLGRQIVAEVDIWRANEIKR